MLLTKSILARLLANENITVRQGNYKTASFNVESRVLQLPFWKDMSSDVYDLLVGHEVAHALWTPREDLSVKGVPFSFVNVVEDIRIEKLVLRKYPGLVSNFSRGYLDLVKRNLFGTEGQDLNEMPFMDRLNLKAKGRQHVDISFTDEEQYYVDLAMSVETFSDVQNVVIEIAEWLKEKQREECEEMGIASEYSPQPSEFEEEDDFGFGPSDEKDSEEDAGDDLAESAQGDANGEEEDASEAGDAKQNGADGQNDEEDQNGEEASTNQPDSTTSSKTDDQTGGESPLDEVATDVAQQENQEGLIDTTKIYVDPVSRSDYEKSLIDYKSVLADRKEVFEQYSFSNPVTFNEFLSESKPIVNMMVKEFEMRKAAYRNLRARTSTKGSLDVSKIHKYKYDDHLFKQVTTLADGKNHGMIMLIDYSGSMIDVLPSVIKQTINLVQFCKRVNIPFRVFAFTSRDEYERNFPEVTSFDSKNLALLELFSSKMSKSEYDYAIRSFYARSEYEHGNKYMHGRLEYLGSTPLDAAVMCMPYVFQDFRKEHPVHKLNLVALTDGASDFPTVSFGKDLADTKYDSSRKFILKINGEEIQFPNRYASFEKQGFTPSLIQAVTGNEVRSINYFIANKNQLWNIVRRDVIGQREATRLEVKEITKKVSSAAKNTGVYVNDNKNTTGYDRQFLLLQRSSKFGGSVADDVQELEVEAGATTSKIAKAFSKHGNSKKKSRIVTQKFAEIVA